MLQLPKHCSNCHWLQTLGFALPPLGVVIGGFWLGLQNVVKVVKAKGGERKKEGGGERECVCVCACLPACMHACV